MLTSRAAISTFLGLCAFVAVFVWVWRGQESEKSPLPQIKNFEECAAAGNPIMESYPAQCRTPNGQLFFETIIEERG